MISNWSFFLVVWTHKVGNIICFAQELKMNMTNLISLVSRKKRTIVKLLAKISDGTLDKMTKTWSLHLLLHFRRPFNLTLTVTKHRKDGILEDIRYYVIITHTISLKLLLEECLAIQDFLDIGGFHFGAWPAYVIIMFIATATRTESSIDFI